ncbi:MAG: hypothetical protein AAGH19_10680 [Pseudomonadota bacterium]
MNAQADLSSALNGARPDDANVFSPGLDDALVDQLTQGNGVVARTTGIELAVEAGAFERLSVDDIDRWLAGPGLRIVLFAGPPKRQRDAHDVAIALRELLRSWPGQASAAVLEPEAEADQMKRFRVSMAPSLALCAGGAVVEVVPGVRDWADYAAVFRRYLGAASHG